MKVVVTGASGFVGRELVAMLGEQTDWDVVAASREHDRTWPQRVQVREMPDLTDAGQTRALSALVAGAQAVVHLAALTPGRNEASDILAFRAANLEGTDRIVRACMAHDVKKFIMMSSSRVSGAITTSRPIDETSPANPDDAYAWSKLMAEESDSGDQSRDTFAAGKHWIQQAGHDRCA
jgi:nucleoside-diphosphate-sugar epimerase